MAIGLERYALPHQGDGALAAYGVSDVYGTHGTLLAVIGRITCDIQKNMLSIAQL